MAIQIPGYKPVFENSAYESDAVTTEKRGDSTIDVRKVILPTRYTQPSKNDVVKYLQTKANRISNSLVLPKGVAAKNEGTLDGLLKKLPDSMLRDIRTGDTECEEFIRENTSAPTESGTQYLQVMYGELPAELIETNKKAGTVKSPDWYKTAMIDKDMLKAQFGIQWMTKIKLDKGILPAKQKIDFLIEEGTYGSKTFVVTDKDYDQDDVRAVTSALYCGLETDFAVSQLPDVSDKVLEENSSESIGALIQMAISQQDAMMKMFANQARAQVFAAQKDKQRGKE